MNSKPEPRRVFLTALFVLWLSAQSVVVALSPAWGFVLPHEHITRGLLSERAWQEHLREHRLGVSYNYEFRCEVTNTSDVNHVLASVPVSSGALSLFSIAAADVQEAAVAIPNTSLPATRVLPATYCAQHVSISPLEPPPNL